MAELSEYGIDEDALRRMYEEWRSGVAKSTLEARYLGKTSSHGKIFTSLVRRYLGIETEKRSSLAGENARLRALLATHGIDPDSEPPATDGEHRERVREAAAEVIEGHADALRRLGE